MLWKSPDAEDVKVQSMSVPSFRGVCSRMTETGLSGLDWQPAVMALQASPTIQQIQCFVLLIVLNWKYEKWSQNPGPVLSSRISKPRQPCEFSRHTQADPQIHSSPLIVGGDEPFWGAKREARHHQVAEFAPTGP